MTLLTIFLIGFIFTGSLAITAGVSYIKTRQAIKARLNQ